MKKLKIFLTFILLLIFIWLRIQVRILNPLWADEIAEISNLISIRHLVFNYLPGIPGGSPGHYLLVLPLNYIFSNKYILGLPGLISQVLVFIFLSKIIEKLKVVKEKQIFLVSTVTRILYIFDPTLTFQAVEVRPYSMLPFFWMLSVFIIPTMIDFDKTKVNFTRTFIYFLFFIFGLLIILNWHYYVAIMLASVYLYSLSKENFCGIQYIYKRKSFIVIFFSILFSIPIWKHFSHGSSGFYVDTFKTIPAAIMQISVINKGFPKGLVWQNSIYALLLLIMLVICISVILSFIKKNILALHSTSRDAFIKVNVFLVFLPISVIFILDYMNRYWFLLRQFAWVMLPFYISIGLFINGIIKL